MSATEEPELEITYSKQPLQFDSAKNCTTVENVLLVDRVTTQNFAQYANTNTFVIGYEYENTIDEVMEVLTPRFTKIKRVALVQHYSSKPRFLSEKQLFGTESRNALVKIVQTFQVDNLDFLACRTLPDPSWVNLYDYLKSKTSVVVGASNDNTGNLKYGGNWVLENTNQNIKTVYFNSTIGEYSSLLDTKTISYTDDNGYSYDLTFTYTVGATTASVSSASIGTYGTNVTIPSSMSDDAGNSYTVTSIAGSAFLNEVNLGDVNLPTTLTSIGGNAFRNCYGLTGVIGLENTSVTQLGGGTFQMTDKASITATSFSIDITGITKFTSSNVFRDSHVGPHITTATSLYFQTSGSHFYGCEKIETVTMRGISRGNSWLGGFLFKYCTNLHTVVLESGTTYINGNEMFGYCTSLTSVTLPDTLTAFYDNTFLGCTALTALSIPASFTSFQIASTYSANKKQFITDNNLVLTFENDSSFPDIDSMYLTETATVFISSGVSSTNSNLISFQSAHPNVETRCFPSSSSIVENNVEMSKLTPYNLTDTSVVGTTDAEKRSYSRSMVETFMNDNNVTLSGKRLKLKQGAVLPGYSDSLTNDVIVINAASSVSSSMTNILTVSDMIENDFYILLDAGDTLTIPSSNDTVKITKIDETTYRVQTNMYTDTVPSETVYYYDGLTLNLGSVFGSFVEVEPICFREGSLITCLDNDTGTDKEVAIEKLTCDDYVKTYKHGYIRVARIGTHVVSNPGNDQRLRNRLYCLSPAEYPELKQELYITGYHSILVDTITEKEQNDMREILGNLYKTDDKYRLIAICDARAKPYEHEGKFKVWHVCLEHYDDTMNYGIYGNGLLVESCSARNMALGLSCL